MVKQLLCAGLMSFAALSVAGQTATFQQATAGSPVPPSLRTPRRFSAVIGGWAGAPRAIIPNRYDYLTRSQALRPGQSALWISTAAVMGAAMIGLSGNGPRSASYAQRAFPPLINDTWGSSAYPVLALPRDATSWAPVGAGH